MPNVPRSGDALEDEWWDAGNSGGSAKGPALDAHSDTDSDDQEGSEGEGESYSGKMTLLVPARSATKVSSLKRSAASRELSQEAKKAKAASPRDVPNVKKKKRRTITDVLRETGCQPAKADDVIGAVRKHFSSKLSAVEMDALTVLEAKHFQCAPPMMPSSLSASIKSAVPKWKKSLVEKTPQDRGTPLLIVVCSSAVRAVELIRSLRTLGEQDGRQEKRKLAVAKLFGKHMKLTEQMQFLAKMRFSIGVGNPGRISALAKAGSLSLQHLKWVVLDWNWRDVKQKRMVDIPDVKDSLMSFLYDSCLPVLESNELQFILY